MDRINCAAHRQIPSHTDTTLGVALAFRHQNVDARKRCVRDVIYFAKHDRSVLRARLIVTLIGARLFAPQALSVRPMTTTAQLRFAHSTLKWNTNVWGKRRTGETSCVTLRLRCHSCKKVRMLLLHQQRRPARGMRCESTCAQDTCHSASTINRFEMAEPTSKHVIGDVEMFKCMFFLLKTFEWIFA